MIRLSRLACTSFIPSALTTISRTPISAIGPEPLAAWVYD